MSKNKNISNDTIERFLLNQLSGQELLEFRMTLMRDKDLQKRVESMRLILKTVRDRNKEKSPSEISHKPRKSIWLLIVGIILVGAIYLIWQKEVPQDTSHVKLDVLPLDTLEASTDSIFNEVQTITPPSVKEEKTSITPPPAKTEKQEQPKKATPEKIEPQEKPILIAANYDPNPALERYVGTQSRGDEYEFKVIIPNTLTLVDNQLDFSISGELETDYNEIESEISASLFTNKIEDYEESRPIKTWNLSFEPKGENFQFQIEESFKAEPGLYYILIENQEEGIFYFVGKMILK